VRLRHVLKLHPAPEFEAWLARMGLLDAQGRLLAEASSAATQFLIAAQQA
jgi:ethanolamine ammonia-lyase large subunit